MPLYRCMLCQVTANVATDPTEVVIPGSESTLPLKGVHVIANEQPAPLFEAMILFWHTGLTEYVCICTTCVGERIRQLSQDSYETD